MRRSTWSPFVGWATSSSTDVPDTSVEPGSGRPVVLFVCVHNAGRSQMAARYLEHLSFEVEVIVRLLR